MWVVSFTLRLLYLRGNRHRYPFDRSLGGPQSRPVCRVEENILDPTGTRTSTSLLQPRSQSLSRLLFVRKCSIRKLCILIQDYTVPQRRRADLEQSLPWKPRTSHALIRALMEKHFLQFRIFIGVTWSPLPYTRSALHPSWNRSLSPRPWFFLLPSLVARNSVVWDTSGTRREFHFLVQT
jgi:hypothetical protein